MVTLIVDEETDSSRATPSRLMGGGPGIPT